MAVALIAGPLIAGTSSSLVLRTRRLRCGTLRTWSWCTLLRVTRTRSARWPVPTVSSSVAPSRPLRYVGGWSLWCWLIYCAILYYGGNQLYYGGNQLYLFSCIRNNSIYNLIGAVALFRCVCVVCVLCVPFFTEIVLQLESR